MKGWVKGEWALWGKALLFPAFFPPTSPLQPDSPLDSKPRVSGSCFPRAHSAVMKMLLTRPVQYGSH